MKNERPDISVPLWTSNGHAHRSAQRRTHVLITGGAGFIGCNVAAHLMSAGQRVLVYDNLSRPGVERNLSWLQQQYPDLLEVVIADIRDRRMLRKAVHRANRVFHFAAQVAVTTSLDDPAHDFDVNARGTLLLLEELRAMSRRGQAPPLLFTSTNKVYGSLPHVGLRRRDHRYEPIDDDLRQHGVSESCNLDFHSPYGCSKGMADQMVIDWARSYDLRTVVFRMSCIYGPHQCGTEDQGWVAHFLIRALGGQPITLYGDGMQVRDLLFVDDLVNAMMLAHEHIDELSATAFNMGGGPHNTISLLELMDMIEEVHGERPQIEFAPWRIGDQKYFTADTRKFRSRTGWQPRVSVRDGVERLYQWLCVHGAAATPSRLAQPHTASTQPSLVQ